MYIIYFVHVHSISLNKSETCSELSKPQEPLACLLPDKFLTNPTTFFLPLGGYRKSWDLTVWRLSPLLPESASPAGAFPNGRRFTPPHTTLCLASGPRQMHACSLISSFFPSYPTSSPGGFHRREAVGKATCDPGSLAKCTWITAEKDIPTWYVSDRFLLHWGMLGVKCSKSFMNESPAVQIRRD